MREVRAAVLRQAGGPFRIEPVRMSSPRPDEVVVRIVATGMCHADILVRDQEVGPPLPIVLGHEGAGIVVERGVDVDGVEIGDHVVLSFAFCGACDRCLSSEQAYCYHAFAMNWSATDRRGHKALHDAHGEPLGDHFFGQSSFATYATVNQRSAIRVPKDAPLELLGPLGCGIQTGAGAVMNSLRVTTGSSFLCLGAGAVGMSALLASRICGAGRAIVVDVVPSRLDLAMELGATHAVDGREPDTPAKILELTGGGANFVLDTTGVSEVISMGIESLAPRGTIGLVAGIGGRKAEFDVTRLFSGGRTIKGIVEGDSVARIFIPQLVELYRQGRFPFHRLVRYYDFEEINQAAEDSVNGTAIKPIVRMAEA
ncbi:NAD(P)-dependent alcohol dehydrogenase [uncultured Sphingomonas sp.]|uniref:NAD(P)-dependent alcohol dehydrogenase n=1 Tax=uncultured Sphingomonas sp. TaxID=158754 RepID=UPI0035CB8AB1